MERSYAVIANLLHSLKIHGDKIASSDNFEAYLLECGWLIDIDDDTLNGISAIKKISTSLSELNNQLTAWLEEKDNETEVNTEESATESIESKDKEEKKNYKKLLKELYPLVKSIYKEILKLKDLEVSDLNLLGVLEDKEAREAFKKEIPENIINDIFTLTLERHYAILYGFLHTTGIIQYTFVEPLEDYRVHYTKTSINWDNLSKLVSGQIGDLFNDAYNWNNGKDLDWEKLLHAVERSFLANRFLMRYVLPRKSVVDPTGIPDTNSFDAYVTPDYMVAHELNELQLPFVYGTSVLDESFYNISLAMMPIAEKGKITTTELTILKTIKPKGFLITPIIQGGTNHSFFLTPEIALKLASEIGLTNSVAVAIFPDEVIFENNLGTTLQSEVKIGLEGNPYEPWVAIGSSDSHRLEIHGFDLSLAVLNPTKPDDVEVKISLQTISREERAKGIQTVILLGDADNFLKENIDQEAITIGLDLLIEWSNKTGFRLGGSAGMNYQSQVNKKLGPIELTNLYLELAAADTKGNQNTPFIQFRAGLGIIGELGPVSFQVENMGFSMDLVTYSMEEAYKRAKEDEKNKTNDKTPLLGNLDLDFGFAPPKGLGFYIDAKAVKGGGYLEFNTGEYLGYAELSILDKFSVKAFGIITTQLPDGQSGYSFLLMILAEFQPLQIGMGFTLNKVGGLIGLHRDMNVDNIIAGVDNDSFKHILFPENPQDDIDAVFNSLNAIFPIRKGQYSFGIMAELGWSNNLILIKAGLFFSVPDFSIAVIGLATAAIQRGEKTLVYIQFKFSATYNESLFTFDASLEGSKLLIWTIDGDIAVRVRGGEVPYFLLSAGGFHKKVSPPEGLKLRKMDRLSVTFFEGNPHVYAELYFAITSNTLQFGGKGVGTYRKYGLGFDAILGFDALIQFNPLEFEAEIYGGVELYAFGKSFFGVRLRGVAVGPYPLKLTLYVTVKVWKFSKTVRVPLSPIGEKNDTELAGVKVLPILLEQLEEERNWEAVFPSTTYINVTIRNYDSEVPTGEAPPDAIKKYHPLGGIIIRQNRVPLNLPLDHFGYRPTEDYRKFRLLVNNRTVDSVEEFFAPGLFFEIPKTEQFKRKSYEKLEAGIEVSGQQTILGGPIIEKEVAYEFSILDPKKDRPSPPTRNTKKPSRLFNHFAKNTTIAKSARGLKRSRNIASSKKGFQLKATRYAIKRNDQTTPFGAAYKNIKTQSEAYILLKELKESNPQLKNNLEVVPMYEVEALSNH